VTRGCRGRSFCAKAGPGLAAIPARVNELALSANQRRACDPPVRRRGFRGRAIPSQRIPSPEVPQFTHCGGPPRGDEFISHRRAKPKRTRSGSCLEGGGPHGRTAPATAATPTRPERGPTPTFDLTLFGAPFLSGIGISAGGWAADADRTRTDTPPVSFPPEAIRPDIRGSSTPGIRPVRPLCALAATTDKRYRRCN
jgi:hypothetical protein